jgi:hypothetical protein
VGADIARGNQGEKGNKALLVINANNKKILTTKVLEHSRENE